MPKLIIPGPEGRIEARYEGNDDESAPIALILHPHPQHKRLGFPSTPNNLGNSKTSRNLHSACSAPTRKIALF